MKLYLPPGRLLESYETSLLSGYLDKLSLNASKTHQNFRMYDLSELEDNIEYSQILELNNVLIEINK